MPRAAGLFKIIEKINDNAYKLALTPEFGVIPTFNVADLKPYLGEDDDLESRTTPIQEGEDDKDITLLDIHNNLPMSIQGPITRARARQLNLEVSSFLSTFLFDFGTRLLPYDYIMIRNQRGTRKYSSKGLEA
jgi:hypothetical protein